MTYRTVYGSDGVAVQLPALDPEYDGQIKPIKAESRWPILLTAIGGLLVVACLGGLFIHWLADHGAGWVKCSLACGAVILWAGIWIVGYCSICVGARAERPYDRSL